MRKNRINYTYAHNNMDKFKKHKVEREKQVKKQSRVWW